MTKTLYNLYLPSAKALSWMHQNLDMRDTGDERLAFNARLPNLSLKEPLFIYEPSGGCYGVQVPITEFPSILTSDESDDLLVQVTSRQPPTVSPQAVMPGVSGVAIMLNELRECKVRNISLNRAFDRAVRVSVEMIIWVHYSNHHPANHPHLQFTLTGVSPRI